MTSRAASWRRIGSRTTALLRDEIAVRYAVRMVGQVDSVREAFWLISGERRITHPAIQRVVETAREILFAGAASKS